MKENTKILLKNLSENFYRSQLDAQEEKNPNASYGDVTISEAIENFEECKSILLDSIGSGFFEKLSYKVRGNIKSSLDKVNQNNYNASHLIRESQNFCDSVQQSGLINMGDNAESYLNEIGALKQLKKELASRLKRIDKSEEIIETLHEKEAELNGITSTVNELSTSIQTSYDQAEKVKQSIDEQHGSDIDAINEIDKLEREASNKRNAIDVFEKNIKEYKGQIDNLQERAMYVVESKNEIEQIREQAKQALSLTSTVGISAALSDQYKKASNKAITIYWIIASSVFLLLALSVSIWIVLGWGIVDSESWTQLIGRIVIITILISAATFCARQYVKQKNLIEDYAYKLTLAKSIIAFKDEIQKVDPNLVSDYLTSVLKEIHQDPLRIRVKQKEITLNDKAISTIENAIVSLKNTIQS